jgi:hypothetical protein
MAVVIPSVWSFRAKRGILRVRSEGRRSDASRLGLASFVVESVVSTSHHFSVPVSSGYCHHCPLHTATAHRRLQFTADCRLIQPSFGTIAIPRYARNDRAARNDKGSE